MIKKPENLVEEYCNRADHQGFSNFIHSATDYEKAKATCNETLQSLNEKRYADIKKSEYFWLERDNARSVDETAELVAKHFGLEEPSANCADGKTKEGKTKEGHLEPGKAFANGGLQMRKVEKDTPLAEEFLHFVENCSWTEVRDHIAGLIRNWEFTDWETMFAAVVDGKIVGMTSLLKEDYYPLPEIFPWVSCVFVEKEYRGKRISEKLIARANEYAQALGFDKTYIPTEFCGFYEKYGYSYLKDIVNYGGGTDRLYVKEL